MLVLVFEGWAQCRLATDPDPSDEPRGISGWTFAVAGEPDLDRVLRFQPAGATPRSFGPAIGVRVSRVDFGEQFPRFDPFVGAAVDLLDGPVFDGRNGLAWEDQFEPIVPFHIRVEGPEVVIDRKHADSVTGVWEVTPALGSSVIPVEIADRLGIASQADRVAYRARRAARLREAFEAASSESERVALAKRLEMFAPDAPSITLATLGAALQWELELEGEALVEDSREVLSASIDSAAPWSLNLGIGVWDADALCAYVWGTIGIPLLG